MPQNQQSQQNRMSQNKQSMNMEEKDLLKDALTVEKQLTANYSTFTGECASPTLYQDFKNLLTDTHDIQYDLFNEMHSRGWYPTPSAEQNKVEQAKQKFQSSMP